MGNATLAAYINNTSYGNNTLGSLVNNTIIGNVALGSLVNNSTMGNATLATIVSNLQSFGIITNSSTPNLSKNGTIIPISLTNQNNNCIQVTGNNINFLLSGTYLISGMMNIKTGTTPGTITLDTNGCINDNIIPTSTLITGTSSTMTFPFVFINTFNTNDSFNFEAIVTTITTSSLNSFKIYIVKIA